MLYLAIVLALLWGGIWASFIEFTPLGRYLADKRTWITVVVGGGVDVVIMRLALDWDAILVVFLVILASSVGIITRSLINEWKEDRGVLDDIRKVVQQEAGE